MREFKASMFFVFYGCFSSRSFPRPVSSAHKVFEMERLEMESGHMHTCTAEPLSACCSADCRRALRSESRLGLWERGNSESPEEEGGELCKLGHLLEGT